MALASNLENVFTAAGAVAAAGTRQPSNGQRGDSDNC